MESSCRRWLEVALMKQAPDTQLKNPQVWYIPHHGIYSARKPDKNSGGFWLQREVQRWIPQWQSPARSRSKRFFSRYRKQSKICVNYSNIKQAQTSSNIRQLIASSEVDTLLQMHPTQNEGVQNLSVNMFHWHAALKDCDIKLYHKVYSETSYQLWQKSFQVHYLSP